MHILLTMLTSVLRKFSITKLVLYLGMSFKKKNQWIFPFVEPVCLV